MPAGGLKLRWPLPLDLSSLLPTAAGRFVARLLRQHQISQQCLPQLELFVVVLGRDVLDN
jgi:hypothetical protein